MKPSALLFLAALLYLLSWQAGAADVVSWRVCLGGYGLSLGLGGAAFVRAGKGVG